MEEGYPCALEARCTYSISDDKIEIIHWAKIIPKEEVEDKETIVNLTNHAYFNLSGGNTRDILDHKLKLGSLKYVGVTNDLIPLSTEALKLTHELDFTAQR